MGAGAVLQPVLDVKVRWSRTVHAHIYLLAFLRSILTLNEQTLCDVDFSDTLHCLEYFRRKFYHTISPSDLLHFIWPLSIAFCYKGKSRLDSI